jgi:hypothetical protein
MGPNLVRSLNQVREFLGSATTIETLEPGSNPEPGSERVARLGSSR